MSDTQIDFWFTMGSTYSFFSVMRLAELERSTGISFRWRPFHLLIILQEMKHVPFADNLPSLLICGATSSDVRPCTASGHLPAPYPAKHSVMANLVAIWGCAKAGVLTLCARPIGAGFSLGRRPEASPTSRRACGILARTRRACWRWQIRKMPKSAYCRDRRGERTRDFRLTDLPWIANFSGATTGWRMRSVGVGSAASTARLKSVLSRRARTAIRCPLLRPNSRQLARVSNMAPRHPLLFTVCACAPSACRCNTPTRPPAAQSPKSPLVLTDVNTNDGVVGHSMVFTYTPAALKPTAGLHPEL